MISGYKTNHGPLTWHDATQLSSDAGTILPQRPSTQTPFDWSMKIGYARPDSEGGAAQCPGLMLLVLHIPTAAVHALGLLAIRLGMKVWQFIEELFGVSHERASLLGLVESIDTGIERCVRWWVMATA